MAATSSVVTSFMAGLPVYALTGSRRESQNFSLHCSPIPPAR
ncbi:MAG: hypothetical protein R3E50_08610 [Halioglobus sp.]